MTRAYSRSRLLAVTVLAVPFVVVGPSAGRVWGQAATARPSAADASTRATVAATQPGPATQPRAATRPADAAPAAEAPPADTGFLLVQRQQRDASRSAYAHLPDGGTVPVEKIVRLTDDGDGLLDLEPGPLAGPTYQRFTAGGSPAAWMLTRSTPAMQNMVLPNGGIGPVTVSTTTLMRVDLTAADDADFWSVRCSQVSPTGYTSVSGQAVRGTTSLTLYRSRRNLPAAAKVGIGAANAIGAVNVYVSEWQPLNANNGPANGGVGLVRPLGLAGPQLRSVVKFRAAADSMAELRAAHVVEFRRHVIPLLSKVSDLDWLTPGAGDVYAAFADLPADPQVSSKLASLLPELDADEAGTRDAAGEKLMALGADGALAALRTDPSSLSVEQRGQLGRLVAAHRRRGLPPAEARRDPAFLLDALEYPDPAVRSAAKAALETVLGQPLTFDARLTGEPLGLAADAVRVRAQELLTGGGDPATRPATKPVP